MPLTRNPRNPFYGVVLASGLLLTGHVLAEDVITPSSVRDALAGLIPPGLTVTDVNAKSAADNIWRIIGTFSSSDQASRFLRNLSATTTFKSPMLEQTQKKADQKTAFIINVQLMCPKPGEKTEHNPCSAERAASQMPSQQIYRCKINGVTTFQSTACS